MATVAHQPWKPTCWVGGLFIPSSLVGFAWVDFPDKQLCEMEDDSRAKYAATKATAAILQAMRKPSLDV